MSWKDQLAGLRSGRYTGGLTTHAIATTFEECPGVVIVHVHDSARRSNRYTIKVFVRGGDSAAINERAEELREFLPIGIMLEIDHAPAERHHYTMAANTWLTKFTIF